MRNSREIDFSPEKPKEQIITNYPSSFDQVPSNPEEFNNFKNKLKPIINRIIDAWTVPDLYSATKEIINLPHTNDESIMRLQLLHLCSAEIPGLHKKPPSPIAVWVYTIIDHHILLRLASITSKK